MAMYKKYQRINLCDVLDEKQITATRNDLMELSKDEQKKYLPYIERYILVAIRERFPNIPKSTLRKKCLRIARKEFAFAYSP